MEKGKNLICKRSKKKYKGQRNSKNYSKLSRNLDQNYLLAHKGSFRFFSNHKVFFFLFVLKNVSYSKY